MTAWLRLVGRPSGEIDLAVLRWATALVRSDGLVWVGAHDPHRVELRRELAFAGIGTIDEERPRPRADLVAALGMTLAPSAGAALELLSLERIPLAEASRRVLGPRLPRRLLAGRRRAREHACRELLRGIDELAWWERRAWLPAGALREAAVRRCFRPIVFDRAALDSPRRGGVLRAGDGAITRWAFE